MPRRKRPIRREVLPDVKYNSGLITSFINCLMMQGKRDVASGILYKALDLIAKKVEGEPMDVFTQAVENVKPLLEVKSRRVGGATYQVPVEVRPERRQSLAIRWIIAYARTRPEKTMREKLANEIVDAYKKTGLSIKKREDTHKMAEANKAFAHYRW